MLRKITNTPIQLYITVYLLLKVEYLANVTINNNAIFLIHKLI